jgi:membrane-bound lytic murein transglycosylase D
MFPMFQRIKKPYIIFSLVAVSGLLAVSGIFYRTARGTADNETDPEKDPRKNYAVFALDLPEDLQFAGENVPLGEIDILENLDRELLVNTYWQSQTLLMIKRANRYFPAIEQILKKYGIPDDIKYLAVAESGLTNVVSPANAVGFWQLLEGTARDYGLEVNDQVDERYHIEKSTEVACRYLLESFSRYGTWTLTAASYNAGRKGVDRQIGRQKESNYYDLLLGDETGRYIYRVLSFKLIMEHPADYGFFLGSKHLYPPVPYYEVTVDGKVDDFADFAKRYGISYKTLKWMNPWLRDSCLINPNGKTYYIRIPKAGYFKSNAVSGAAEDTVGIRQEENMPGEVVR